MGRFKDERNVSQVIASMLFCRNWPEVFKSTVHFKFEVNVNSNKDRTDKFADVQKYCPRGRDEI